MAASTRTLCPTIAQRDDFRRQLLPSCLDVTPRLFLNVVARCSTACRLISGELDPLIMPPTLKKLMGHIAFGACVRGWVRAWVGVSHFLYLL